MGAKIRARLEVRYLKKVLGGVTYQVPPSFVASISHGIVGCEYEEDFGYHFDNS